MPGYSVKEIQFYQVFKTSLGFPNIVWCLIDQGHTGYEVRPLVRVTLQLLERLEDDRGISAWHWSMFVLTKISDRSHDLCNGKHAIRLPPAFQICQAHDGCDSARPLVHAAYSVHGDITTLLSGDDPSYCVAGVLSSLEAWRSLHHTQCRRKRTMDPQRYAKRSTDRNFPTEASRHIRAMTCLFFSAIRTAFFFYLPSLNSSLTMNQLPLKPNTLRTDNSRVAYRP